MRFLRHLPNLKGKKVLLRVCYDVPIIEKEGKLVVADDFRIRATLPTINYLLKKDCTIILISYLGRPPGKVIEKYRLTPVAQRLSFLLKRPVKKLDDCIGDKVEKEVKKAKPKDVIMLENTRFHPEEDNNDLRFAKKLAKLGEIYINDAFGQIHRTCASIVGIPKLLPAYAGFLLAKEIRTLSEILSESHLSAKNQRGRQGSGSVKVAVLGGLKISTKLPVITNLLSKVDYLLLGGALANTYLFALGLTVGKSIIEQEMVDSLKNIKLTENKLRLPIDVVVAKSNQPATKKVIAVAKVGRDEMILDIGPETIELYGEIIKTARLIIWNGPLGMFEQNEFSYGTKKIAHLIAQSRAKSIIGGAETIEAANQIRILNKFSFVSTGGGAMLDFLAGKKLPGIEALKYGD